MDVFQMRAAVREEQIERLVREFYDRAREDELLGPIFRAQVPDERWEAHLAKICAFWSTALRGTGRYRANPIEAHRPLRVPDGQGGDEGPLRAEHFDRWLGLFEATAHEVFDAEIAGAIDRRARRMATHMVRVLA